MDFKKNFISASSAYATQENFVSAPYMRKTFVTDVLPEKSEIIICGLGFYELFINGTKITKGLLCPFITNPDHILYYDVYDLKKYLKKGKNVIGILLGNGFLNSRYATPWEFEKADFRSAPKVDFEITNTFADGKKEIIISDTSVKCHDSPIISDDYRAGEIYDANLEIPDWNGIDFDDSHWKNALTASKPRGKCRIYSGNYIKIEKELECINITPYEEGYLYEFPENNAGVCRLKINGEKNQVITTKCAECLENGVLMHKFLCFNKPYDNYLHSDVYKCKGEGTEVHFPNFVYHGFKYVYVKGITKEQATKDLLTFVVFHTELKERGNFSCSDKIANKLQEMVRRSTVSNFHHFPTDCPQREKNGWTADASLSCVHTLLNLEPDLNYTEWQRSICKAQDERGALPGIVPTSGWGFNWGNGPAWDSIISEIPYEMFKYRGNLTPAKESANALLRYLEYLTTRVNSDGLLAIGLGDWCQVNRSSGNFIAPLELTDTLIAMDISKKCSVLFGVLGRNESKLFADAFYNRLKTAARTHLIDTNTMLAIGNCQTSQAMAVYYGIFENGEQTEAVKHLVEMINKNDGHMDVGVLGGRVIFDVLCNFGYCDLAYNMITRTDYASYGEWAARGETTLRECFSKTPKASLNHHFWGDISRFFIEKIAGIVYNPRLNGGECDIIPHFVNALDYADAFHIAPEGKISVHWEKQETSILLNITAPDTLKGKIILPNGYIFDGVGYARLPLKSGNYKIFCK